MVLLFTFDSPMSFVASVTASSVVMNEYQINFNQQQQQKLT